MTAKFESRTDKEWRQYLGNEWPMDGLGCAPPGWMLLRKVVLPFESSNDHDRVLQHSMSVSTLRPNQAVNNLRTVLMTTGARERLLMPTDFEQIELDDSIRGSWSSSYICNQTADQNCRWQSLWITGTSVTGGAVEIIMLARLRSMFAELIGCYSTPEFFECHWRLRSLLDLPTLPKIDSDGLLVNSTLIEGVTRVGTPDCFLLPLLPHQEMSLAWMIHRERNKDLFVCEETRRHQFPSLDDFFLEIRLDQAFDLRGGVLCDPIGSGKTAVVFALICVQRSVAEQEELDCPAESPQPKPPTPTATLVLCPANVHEQWLDEAKKFCGDSLRTLSVRSFDDLLAADSELFLRSCDIAVAPYDMFDDPRYKKLEHEMFGSMLRVDNTSHKVCPASRVRKKGRILHSVFWNRLVLDEFHELAVDSHKSRRSADIFNAVRRLRSVRRWGLSGTAHAFLRSLTPISACARLLRCEISEQSAASFVEHTCRSSADFIELDIEVQPHTCMINSLPEERALYLHHWRNLGVPWNLGWNELGPLLDNIRTLVQLCSSFRAGDHWQDSESAWDQVAVEDRSIGEICTGILQSKSMEMEAANHRVISAHADLWKLFDRQILHEVFNELIRKRSELIRVRPQSSRQAAEIINRGIQMLTTICDDFFGSAFPASLVDLCMASNVIDIPKPALTAHMCRQCSKHGDSNRPFCPHHFVLALKAQREEIQAARAAQSQAVQARDFFQTALNENNDERECPVCLEEKPAERMLVLRCGHALCDSCGPKLNPPRCPFCRIVIKNPAQDVVRLVAAGSASVHQPENQDRSSQWGSKLAAVASKLEEVQEQYHDEKIIIFSQWDALRRELSGALARLGIAHTLLAGNIFQRGRTLRSFQEDPEAKLMLLSLEDSASGTNLTAANHVFLIHPMLTTSEEESKAFEAQAIGRVRRLGQTRDVHVWRFVTRGTVEESLWGLVQAS